MVLTIKLKEVMSAGHAKVQLIHTHAWFHNNKGRLHSFGIIDRSQSHLEPVMRLLVAMATYTHSSQWS